MMFSNKSVICVKSNGKILREFKDAVYVPFGQEYSILFKNLNSVRAVVNIQIDGVDATPGGLVVNANSEVDLERFIKDGNMSAGNRFKFIERTAGIEDFRGIKADDGLIRVSFKYEKVVQPYVYPQYTPGHWEWRPEWKPGYRGWPYDNYTDCCGSGPYYANGVAQSSSSSDSMIGGSNATLSANAASPSKGILRSTAASINTVSTQGAPVSDVGITVPGSVSNQKFVVVKDFPLEAEEHVMVLRLLGETESGKEVLKPVTVKAKPRCVTCGRQNKATSSFCAHCGTALEIV